MKMLHLPQSPDLLLSTHKLDTHKKVLDRGAKTFYLRDTFSLEKYGTMDMEPRETKRLQKNCKF